MGWRNAIPGCGRRHTATCLPFIDGQRFICKRRVQHTPFNTTIRLSHIDDRRNMIMPLDDLRVAVSIRERHLAAIGMRGSQIAFRPDLFARISLLFHEIAHDPRPRITTIGRIIERNRCFFELVHQGLRHLRGHCARQWTGRGGASNRGGSATHTRVGRIATPGHADAGVSKCRSTCISQVSALVSRRLARAVGSLRRSSRKVRAIQG